MNFSRRFGGEECGAIMLGFCAAACGQLANGQFNGHVFDQNGAAVPGATVTLQDVQTSLSRSTETNGWRPVRISASSAWKIQNYGDTERLSGSGKRCVPVGRKPDCHSHPR